MSALLSQKITDEKVFVDFDFTPLLSAGVTIASATVVASVYSGTDSNPSAIISGSATAQTPIVSQLIVGGLNGVVYRLDCHATCSNSSELDVRVLLPVVDNRLG